MKPNKRYRRQRGQAREEVLLVLVVCAIALIAMLSVFVPGLRHAWRGLGRALGVAPQTPPAVVVLTNDVSHADTQGR